MSAQDTERAAPAGIRHDPKDDQLLGTINASNTTSSKAVMNAGLRDAAIAMGSIAAPGCANLGSPAGRLVNGAAFRSAASLP